LGNTQHRRGFAGTAGGHDAAEDFNFANAHLVACGSWTGIYWASAGVEVEVEFAGIGRVALST
jgi:2-keto-4-pentenoate hydratase